MWVEAVGKAFVYRWRGGSIFLEPGQPVWLPDYRAMRLVTTRPGKVRQVHKLAHEAKAMPSPTPRAQQEVQPELPFQEHEIE